MLMPFFRLQVLQRREIGDCAQGSSVNLVNTVSKGEWRWTHEYIGWFGVGWLPAW